MIPKIIHYCWYGGNKKSKLICDCIASWKSILPDYEIIEWNEKNSDLTNDFVKEAYRLKKWAFVSDYIRLQILYEYGGIYLDTDMMVLKSFNLLLNHKCFFGAENKNFISCGIIGAEPNHFFIKKGIDFYDKLQFTETLDLGMNTIPRIVTGIFRKEFNFLLFFESVLDFEGITIYPLDYFYALPYFEVKNKEKYKEFISPKSLAIHLWNSSWIEYSEFYYIREKEYVRGLEIVCRNILTRKKVSFKYLKKVVLCFGKTLFYKK